MTDTHTHLYMADSFPDDGPEAVARAVDAGVKMMIFPGVDLPTFQSLIELADRFPENVRIAFGIHPTELTPDWQMHLAEMRRQLGNRTPVAVGEVGVDLHWDASTVELQLEAFYHQLKLAWELQLPVIIHSRDALAETLSVIERFRNDNGSQLPQLIFHSFTGSPADVDTIRKVCDPWFGINGVVTFKNARELVESVPIIGLERLLLETDSPYLAPVPWRGQRNESANLTAIRDKIASILKISPQEVEAATDRNARLLFANL